ncbi:PQ loop repeat-domain-containing protein [Phakopsora pachyrhizi]|uniref:PQ loop repeat-domain-containing protein n=1 Tax=Phakopsora pachyrhizi TaxID=170000 RepID=A0AAV0BTQ8_PHAPC|nr:PQ loop repeat-domain-containing protein [Phakopsora pachyrhizi]
MAISDLFGNLSQLFWLFAQVPQIWKNYRLKSVDGISFPFLMSWFAGDFTNLLGCILTDQLPFQRNLAIYFNLVDVILLLQYGCYSKLDIFTTATASNKVYRKYFIGEDHQSLIPGENDDTEEEDDLDSLGAVQENSFRICSNRSPEPGSTPSDRTLAATHIFNSQSAIHRGRALRLTRSFDDLDSETSTVNSPRSHSRITKRDSDSSTNSPLSTPPNKITGPVILLGAFAFLAFNSPLTKSYFSQIPLISTKIPPPRAWSVPGTVSGCSDSIHSSDPSSSQCMLEYELIDSSLSSLLGQVSSWICAGFYLSSRLPQILKNHRRKSVEGLSILLFVMAFLGNLTYVISVLSSAQVRNEPGFLKSSIPYLLGSGGTLCFDVTIYIQSRLYRRPTHPVSSSSLGDLIGGAATATSAATALAINSSLRKQTSRNVIRLSQDSFHQQYHRQNQ